MTKIIPAQTVATCGECPHFWRQSCKISHYMPTDGGPCPVLCPLQDWSGTVLSDEEKKNIEDDWNNDTNYGYFDHVRAIESAVIAKLIEK